MSSPFIHESSFIDKKVRIGENTKIWHFSHVMTGATIGSNCSLGQNVFIGENVEVGNGVKIQNNVSLYEGIILEDYVFCGPSMVFTNVKMPRSEFPIKTTKGYLTTRIKRGASIGANATIICGNNVGTSAFVAAGALVSKDIPDYAIAVGVPAKIVGWVCKCGNKIEFQDELAECNSCGKLFKKKNELVTMDS